MNTNEEHSLSIAESADNDSSIQLSWKNLSVTGEKQTYINNSSGFIVTGKIYLVHDDKNERSNLLLNCLANEIPKDYNAEGKIRFNSETATEKHYRKLVTFSGNEELFYSKAEVKRYLECLAERKKQVDSKKYVHDLLLEHDITFDTGKTFENIEQDELILFYLMVAIINETTFLLVTNDFYCNTNTSWKRMEKVFKHLRNFATKGNCVLIYNKDLFSEILAEVDEVILFESGFNFHCKTEHLSEFFPKNINEEVQKNLDNRRIYELIKTNDNFELCKGQIDLNDRFIKSFSPFLSLITELEAYTKTYYGFFILIFASLIIMMCKEDFNDDNIILYIPCINVLLFPSVIDVFKYLEVTKTELSKEYFTLSQYFIGLLKYNWVSHILLISSSTAIMLYSLDTNLSLYTLYLIIYFCLLQLDLLLVFIIQKKGFSWYFLRKIFLALVFTGMFMGTCYLDIFYIIHFISFTIGIFNCFIAMVKFRQQQKNLIKEV